MATFVMRPAKVILGCLALYCGGQAIVEIVSSPANFVADIRCGVQYLEAITRFITG